MKYQPLLNNLLVKPLPKDEGKIIYDPANEPLRAKIIKMGRGNHYNYETLSPLNSSFDTQVPVPAEIEENDTILFFPQDARRLSLDGKEFYLLDQNDVLLVERG